MGISWRLPFASSWSTSRVTLAALLPSAVFTIWVIPRPWSFAQRDCDMMMMMILTVMVLMIIIINTCSRCGWSQCPDRSGWWWKGLWWGWRWLSVMLAIVVLMIMIIKYTLSKTKFSPSHLQVVQVFDGFDVSNEQVRMNFNGSSRLWNLFEIHIPYYPWRRSWIALAGFFALPVLCSIPSSGQ